MGTFTAITAGLVLTAASLGTASATAVGGSLAPATGRLTNQELAGAVLFGCADSRDRASQMAMSRDGVAGIVLLGSRTPGNLKSQLRAVRRAAPGSPPLIASDEEGGTVQRLSDVIYRLPPAETMGKWSDRKIRRTAERYGHAMARLGVRMSLAPVADLRVNGTYIDQLGRAFSSNPKRVGRAVRAWSQGLEAAGVAPVVKHWPGHGHAVDTHESAARIPAWKKLRKADVVPFRMAFADGAGAVMVGHLQSRGLTAHGEPATQSARALSVLRRQAGPDTVIITDSLSMAAASSARGMSESQAVIASLDAGADWAMVCSTNTGEIVKSVGRAIRKGRLDKGRLLESAARVTALKQSL